MRLGWLPVIASLLVAWPAASAPPSDTKQARRHAERGLELFEQGKHRDAIEAFETAESHYHAPTHVLFIARAHAELGELLEARRLFRSIVDEPLDENAPKAFFRAKVEAREALEALGDRIPIVAVDVRGAGDRPIHLRVDGEPRAVGEMAVDPGTHRLELSAGAERRQRTVEAEEGARSTIVFDLAPPEPDASPWLLPAVASLGIGGASLVAGIATGAASLSHAAGIDEQCEGDRCPPHLADEADTTKALGHASTALVVIGGVGVAAGTTFLLLGDDEEEAAVAFGLGAARLRLRF